MQKVTALLVPTCCFHAPGSWVRVMTWDITTPMGHWSERPRLWSPPADLEGDGFSWCIIYSRLCRYPAQWPWVGNVLPHLPPSPHLHFRVSGAETAWWFYQALFLYNACRSHCNPNNSSEFVKRSWFWSTTYLNCSSHFFRTLCPLPKTALEY